MNKQSTKSSPVFTWLAALLGLCLTIGAYTDAWAHHHIPNLETFFTPWHAFLYGSFALNLLFFVGVALYNFQKEKKSIPNLLPKGYFLSLVGVGLFTVGGIADMCWHILFGVE